MEVDCGHDQPPALDVVLDAPLTWDSPRDGRAPPLCLSLRHDVTASLAAALDSDDLSFRPIGQVLRLLATASPP